MLGPHSYWSLELRAREKREALLAESARTRSFRARRLGGRGPLAGLGLRLREAGRVALSRLGTRARRVEVTVVVRGIVEDSFAASTPRTLLAAIAPVLAHLPARGASLGFSGVEEWSLPLGIARAQLVRRLLDLPAAATFLAGRAAGSGRAAAGTPAGPRLRPRRASASQGAGRLDSRPGTSRRRERPTARSARRARTL